MQQFPFGAPVLERATSLPAGATHCFVLGAYPSALHVRWTPPAASGLKPIKALAVDNEPSPFWDGSDSATHVREWAALHFQDEWGTVEDDPVFNGPSGVKVRDRVIEPLGVGGDVFITDCLPTYRTSEGQEKRIRDTYMHLAPSLGLPVPKLGEHPSENAIVAEAITDHGTRILDQINAAAPEVLVTLGNAASRTLGTLLGKGEVTVSLDHYGEPMEAELQGRHFTWLALAHPAAPKRYQDAHDLWIAHRQA